VTETAHVLSTHKWTPWRLAQRQIGRLGVAMVLLTCSNSAVAQVQHIKPQTQSPDGRLRSALVIGNGAYKASPLKNPVNDARAVAQALSAGGFSVTLIEDGSLVAMRRAVREFGTEITRDGVGLFYYAGHGVQLNGHNYLVPVDADIESEEDIPDQALNADLVLEKMDAAKSGINVMILDACRNNPFARSFRSASRGLAQMDAPSGTIISFATAPGSVAADGEGQNGLYTKYLLRGLAETNVPIEQMFKTIRVGVTKETNDKQVPWESSSLKGDFYFRPTNGEAKVEKGRDPDPVESQKLMAEMRALIAQLDAKQKAEREEEARKRGASPPVHDAAPVAPPASAPVPAPVPEPVAAKSALAGTRAEAGSHEPVPDTGGSSALVGANAAMSPVAVANSQGPGLVGRNSLPDIGDSWTYRIRVRDQYSGVPGPWRQTKTLVRAVADNAVVESTDGAKEKARLPEVSINGAEGDTISVSPYWHLQLPVKLGETWSNIPFQRIGACAQSACTFDAKVSGVESVSVPAGKFDAYVMELVWERSVPASGVSGGHYIWVGKYWYAPAAKRFVKVTWGQKRGFTILPEREMELDSYSLRQSGETRIE
jgi:uncharacterized caspase-like protein